MKHTKLYCCVSAVIVALLLAYPAMAQRSGDDTLVLRGNVRGVKHLPGNDRLVDLEVELDLEFVNTGTRPIIFLQPHKEPQAEIYWPGAISLSLEKFLAERGGCNSTIWTQAFLPAINTSPEFLAMAKRLDQPSPPSDLTHTLQPKESWTWRTTAFLRFYSEKPLFTSTTFDLGWDVIGKIATPLWMRMSYEVWPDNLQRADKGLRKRLQKRWKDSGLLNIQRSLTTEPIELELYKVKLNDTSTAAPNNSFNRSGISLHFIRKIGCLVRCFPPG